MPQLKKETDNGTSTNLIPLLVGSWFSNFLREHYARRLQHYINVRASMRDALALRVQLGCYAQTRTPYAKCARSLIIILINSLSMRDARAGLTSMLIHLLSTRDARTLRAQT